MESSSTVGDSLSPESTVTSLMSSSGHLRSSLRPPEHDTSFRFRDKDYDSASAALDAYIADFERSCQNSRKLTGTLVLPHIQPCTPSRPRLATPRNKDVLRERLTDRELDFLHLPVSSLHHHGNRDRLSMTTDELLTIPNDGSMPVTHTSAFIQGLLTQSGASRSSPPSTCPAHRTCAGPSGGHAAPPHMSQHHALPARTPRSHRCRGRPKVATFKPTADTSSAAHRAARPAWTGSALHLPHWFTSNKADMDCSDISSVPDLMYPAWIQSCGVSEPTLAPPSELWDDHGASRIRAPSWLSDLEKDGDAHQTPAQGQQTLRDLRLQLAEHISLLSAKRSSSDVLTTLFRDNKIESLIQKADQVLNSLSSGGPETLPGPVRSPVNTEDLLCSPPHCPPLTPDSAAGGATEAPADTEEQAWDCSSHGNSFWKQPGPVEALKQMLFKLQAVEAELQRKQREPAAVSESLQTPVKQLADCAAEFPGRPSLQRALHHLSCLKLLVEEPQQKGRKEGEEEKDEDEGRFSSSSADGPICSQQEPS
ncbi:lung adenoma susceptibility protein 2 isoform 1-T3 [Odontesthes bonariensis]|uniref:lung adenoma susceptibility protein 2 n=1 Tax=Odontesthes bonariensis TaxID=219752 RepID=UPI003F5822E9